LKYIYDSSVDSLLINIKDPINLAAHPLVYTRFYLLTTRAIPGKHHDPHKVEAAVAHLDLNQR